MKSIRLEGSGRVRIDETSAPVPGVGEVLIQTAVSAICGSELHSYRGAGVESGNSGHEAVGTIVAVGDGVADLPIGARVGASAIAGCGTCGECAQGRYTWCRDRRFYGKMHAEYFIAAANACYALPEDIPWDAAVLLTGDGLGVPYHTSRKIASEEIRTVAVFGSGPIGLGNVMMQRFFGRRVIAIDVSETRLRAAERLGASDVIDAGGGDSADKVRELTGGTGADVCVEAAGREETALSCFDAVRTGGTVVFNGEQGAIPLSPSEHFIRRDVAAVGSWFYHFAEIPRMIELYRAGLPVLDLISHRFPFEDAETAYRDFAAARTSKVLIKWSGR